MATALVIEEERGTWNGRLHPHNGYFAGDFSRPSGPALRRVPSPARLQAPPVPLPAFRLAA
jgi:hypothetical protein